MSFNVKSNNSNKTAASPNDRRNYVKLYGAANSFWSSTFVLSDNIYNYSRIVIIGKTADGTDQFARYNLNFDIIPGVTEFEASQTILHTSNNMQHIIMLIKECSYSTNKITITGQFRKSDTVNNPVYFSAIYGIK